MTDQKTKISVIVPVYNEEMFLDDCITSICNQTYENLEIILVDDGSSLSCSQKCDSYIAKDDRIKVFHKENGGSLSARRKGIEEATGGYVAFVDSDDWIELELYEEAAKILVKDNPDMLSISNYYRNYTTDRYINTYDNKRIGVWDSSQFAEDIFPYFIKKEKFFDTEFPISMTGYLFRTEFAYAVIRKITNEIKTSEDYVFLMQAFLNARSCAAISYRGYHYRNNNNSKTYTLRNVKKLLQPVYKTVESAIMESNYSINIKELLKKKNIIHIYHAFLIKDYAQLINTKDEYLFPYSKVTKGSKIIIYGAGKLGKQLYNAIKNMDCYEIVGIVDKNWGLYKGQEIKVISPEEILSKEYDYIIFGITYLNIVEQAKNELINLGVSESKFAEIDINVLDEKHLPFELN